MQKDIFWKRLLPVVAVLVLALGLAGCGDQSSSNSSESDSGNAEQGEMVGGWEINAEAANSYLTDDQKTAFDEAYQTSKIEELGWTFNPVAQVAAKDAEGDKETVYFVQGACGDEPSWEFITVKQLEGQDPEFVVDQIAPDSLSTIEDPVAPDPEEGWKFTPVPTGKPMMMPEEAQAAFDKAVEDPANCIPIGLIAKQLVSGTNYLYLVQTTPDGASEPTLAYLTVYADLDGNASVTSTEYAWFMS